jgi:sugar phosphate isomerase/epimerase
MKRREFIGALMGGFLGAGLADNGAESDARTRHRRRRVVHSESAYKLRSIGVSFWSFHRYFPSGSASLSTPTGEVLALLDFPEMVADRYKVHELEFVAPHFASTETAYIQELKSRLLRVHSRVVNLPLDIKEIRTAGGLSDPDKSFRESAVEASKKWIDIAVTLRARSVRCDPGKINPLNLEPTVESYKQLVAYGRPRGIRILVENHGVIGSEHPELLVALFKKVDNDYFGSLPDFANFPNQETRERGLKMLFPYASTVCHAKGLEFDAQGNEAQFNFPACVTISKEAYFRGIYSIEFDGPSDPYQGVQQVINELLKYL